ncbi:sialic acid-binding Ig-like lectin 14 [Anguilla anguilla]|uniref:sialic acid-binding Ig-like lectin 14 n=1 Tax=Anguilla anguilla TaxID=7936 RepID=UPI0015AE5310|nr:sialic acid-binding Ig-like lectin 14 [Anguilla anguilla]
MLDTELMGSFRRSSVLCSVIQGLAVWSVAAAGQPWSVTIPNQMSAPVGSCIVVPCSFTPPTANEAVEVTWYQYVSRGYPLVYSESKPRAVIDKFRDSTELIGSAGEGNCSLKINRTRAAHNAEKIYVWITPNKLDGKFYDQTVTLEVTENAPQPEIRVMGDNLTEGDEVSLSCDVIHTCPPSPPSVSFRNHTGALRWSHNKEEAGRWRVSVETSWKVNSSDHGRGVTCDVTHPGGLTASREIVLHVTYPPKSVSVHGPPNALPPGGCVSLSCSSQANPPATSFQWYRVDQGQPKLLEATSKDMTATNLSRDQNLFRCKASNSAGSGSSPDFEVIKEYAPLILRNSSCTLGNGQWRCECIVDSSPPAKVTWSSVGSSTNESGNTLSTLSGRVLRSVLTGPMGDGGHRFYCNATNEHGDAFYLLPITVEHFGKWGIVLGAIGGAVLICLLLGAFLYCKRTKRRPKHADLSLKKVKCAGEEEVKIDSLYSNSSPCPPAHALPESIYEVEDALRYQEMKRQPSYDDDVYQNY